MPVELDFQADPREATAASATDATELFEESLLVVPVRFNVDGHDILPIRFSSTTTWSVDPSGTATATEPVVFEDWTRQPLLGFMCGLRQAIEAAVRLGQARCYLIDDGDLVLTLRDRSQIVVTFPSGTTAVAPIDQFTDAFSRFEAKIHDWLIAGAPQLMGHPSWAKWFPSGSRLDNRSTHGLVPGF